jgi:hypothetical protein
MIKVYREDLAPGSIQIGGLHEEKVLHEKGGRFIITELECDTEEEQDTAKKTFADANPKVKISLKK